VCYKKTVVEINIHGGDDNVGVEKSPKKNEKMKGHQEKEEKPPKGVGKRVRVTLSSIFWDMMSHFSSIPHEACVQN
jgi:hypothetical protein